MSHCPHQMQCLEHALIMLDLLYRFYPHPNSHFGVQTASLAPWLSQSVQVRLEQMVPLPYLHADWRRLYPLISQSLDSPQAALHHGPLEHLQPHPSAWNIAWIDWEREQHLPHQARLAQADEVWVTSEAEQQALQARLPSLGREVLVFPPPLDGSEFKALPPPPFDMGSGFKFFHMGDWQNFEPTRQWLEAFVVAFADREDVALALCIHANGQQAEIENALARHLQDVGTRRRLPYIKAPIMTLIGTTERNAFLGILANCQAVLATCGYQLALEGHHLGKTVLSPSHAVLDPVLAGSPFYPLDLGQADQLVVQLKAACQAAPPATSAVPDLAEVGQAVLERLEWLLENTDLSQRRALAAEKEAQRRTYQREGRKQKYSLFHQDYNTQEMAARRSWHLRYANYFKGCRDTVLDVGCGSGIFLELLRDLLVPSLGLDLDQDMVDVCQELGLKAILGDDMKIGEFEEAFGGIHASHIIEHVEGDRALAFLENCFNALKPGGILVIRTPNWRNQTVRHEGFWLDATHIRPYPLPLLTQVFKDIGFEITDQGFEESGWNDTYIVGRKPVHD